MRWLLPLFFFALNATAQRMEIPPLEFQPLTSLPWKEKPTATLQEHLHRIFLESDPAIRYPVLAAFLRHIAIKDLETAFDLCVTLEGTQHPQSLIAFFLPIWAERDAKTAWKRTAPLIELQETNWLGYDSWSEEKIAFRNLEAMRRSSYWLDPRWLENFLPGLNLSALPDSEKKVLRDAFMTKWSPIYDSPPSDYLTGRYEHEVEGLLAAFEVPADQIKDKLTLAVRDNRAAAVTMLLRRWLVSQPEKATLITTLAEKLETDSDELYLLWLRHAPATLIEWVDAHLALSEVPYRVMGMVMSRVDAAQREKWLHHVQLSAPEGRNMAALLYEWSAWDPEASMSTAIASKNAYVISQAAEGVVYSFRANHRYGLNFIRDFDVDRLPRNDRPAMLEEWYILMEQWGELDIGEAARYGLDFMLRTDYTPRENLIKLFSGDDAFGSDSDMIDRTFCALRMWAALKPDEVKAWIATQPEADMRKALTWLLDHPWGHVREHLPR